MKIRTLAVTVEHLWYPLLCPKSPTRGWGQLRRDRDFITTPDTSYVAQHTRRYSKTGSCFQLPKKLYYKRNPVDWTLQKFNFVCNRKGILSPCFNGPGCNVSRIKNAITNDSRNTVWFIVKSCNSIIEFSIEYSRRSSQKEKNKKK